MKLKRILLFLILVFGCFILPACKFNVDLSFMKKEPVSILVYSVKEDFKYGESFNFAEDCFVVIKYNDNTTEKLNIMELSFDTKDAITENSDVIVDYSKYQKNLLGEYEILIKYKHNENIKTSFNVRVNKIIIDENNNDYSYVKYDGTYNGNPQKIAVNVPSDASIKYSLDGEEYNLDECPTYKNVGTYTTYFKVERYGYTDFYGQEEVIIKKADLYITPKPVEITYGDQINYASLECIYDGLMESLEDSDIQGQIEYTTGYTTNSNCGTYKISLTENCLSSNNYNIKLNENSLIVKRAAGKLDVEFADIYYGEELTPNVKTNLGNSLITYKYSINGQELYTEVKPISAGTYDIICENQNSINFKSDKIKIENVQILPAKLTVIPKNYDIDFNTNFNKNNAECEFEGFKFTDNEDSLNGTLSFRVYNNIEDKVEYKLGDDVGNYVITIGGLESENYDIEYKTSILTVKKIDNKLKISFKKDLIYNGNEINYQILENQSNQEIKISHQIVGEETIIGGLPKDAGDYIIHIKQDSTKNYNEYDNPYSEIVTIGQKEVKLVWSNTEFFYDGDVHIPSVEVNAESIIGNDVVNVFAKTDTGEDYINASSAFYIARCDEISNSNYKLPKITTCQFYIHKQVVASPTIQSKDYNGGQLLADIESTAIYEVVNNYGGIKASEYNVELKLRDYQNYRWEQSTNETLIVKFVINRIANVISNFQIEDWGYGEAPSQPTYDKTSDDIDFELVVEYKKTSEEESEYSTKVPTKVGEYNVRAYMEQSQNYYKSNIVESMVKINKIDAKYSIVNVINVELGTTLNTVQLPVDSIGLWSWVDNSVVLENEGLNPVEAKFTPREEYAEGYNEVTTTLYLNVIADISTMNTFNKEDIEIKDKEVVAGSGEIYIDVSVSASAENAEVLYSLTQNGEYTENVTLENIPENVGTHIVWIKVTQSGYIPYYTYCMVTIN